MSERIYTKWQQDEEEAYNTKMKKMVRAYEKVSLLVAQKAFQKWKSYNNQSELVNILANENQRLKADLDQATHQNQIYEASIRKRYKGQGKYNLVNFPGFKLDLN